ncbi:MAG: antA/AntB antirepressor family protein [Lachnospiraceae bacterium]|nr:antA/AntB antirepressor family protein [Lachnospiraceae bacterium]
MRMTKHQKNNTAKITTTLPDSNPKIDTSSQTPIEIALKINENGMASLRNLYEFLQLSPSQFTRWCKRNVLQNPFATENIDYFTLRLDVDSSVKGQSKAEYMITSDFAKQLSMTVKNERGQEARKYFIACEQGLKVAAQKLQSISNTGTSEKLIELLTSMDNRLSKLEDQSNKKKLPEKKYSRWKTNTFAKLNTLLSYVNENSDENLKLSEIIHLVIGETEDTYNIELNDYVDAYKSEFDLDTTPYAIDIINHYKDIRDMFTLTLNSIMEKLHIAEDIDRNRSKNIFDELAAKLVKENTTT